MDDPTFTCPTTGRMIESGIETDPNTLARIFSSGAVCAGASTNAGPNA